MIGEVGRKIGRFGGRQRDQIGPHPHRQSRAACERDELPQVRVELGFSAGDVEHRGPDPLGEAQRVEHRLPRHDLGAHRRARVVAVSAGQVTAQADVEHQPVDPLGAGGRRMRLVDRTPEVAGRGGCGFAWCHCASLPCSATEPDASTCGRLFASWLSACRKDSADEPLRRGPNRRRAHPRRRSGAVRRRVRLQSPRSDRSRQPVGRAFGSRRDRPDDRRPEALHDRHELSHRGAGSAGEGAARRGAGSPMCGTTSSRSLRLLPTSRAGSRRCTPRPSGSSSRMKPSEQGRRLVFVKGGYAADVTVTPCGSGPHQGDGGRGHGSAGAQHAVAAR